HRQLPSAIARAALRGTRKPCPGDPALRPPCQSCNTSEIRHDLQWCCTNSGLTTSPGRYAGQDNGFALAFIYPALIEFDKSIIKYPNIRRFPGGGSDDLIPNLQHPDNPVPLLKGGKEPHVGGGSDSSNRGCIGTRAKEMMHFSAFVLAATLAIASVAVERAYPATAASVPTEDSVRALALHWF